MTLSPLQFAKEWEKQKSRVAASQSGDQNILLLCHFWTHLATHADDTAYGGYFDEYRALLLPLINEDALADLTPSEIESVADVLQLLGRLREESAITSAMGLAHSVAAKLNFYVGDLRRGLDHAARFLNRQPPIIDDSEMTGLTEMAALSRLIEQLAPTDQAMSDYLVKILEEWQAERAAVSNESAYCLLVESDGAAMEPRGRLKLLQGDVEVAGNHATTDKVTFHNVVVAPNDPLIGGAYRSIEAVRRLLLQQGIKPVSAGRINANFAIVGADHRLTGESLGLAFGIVAYTQLLKVEALRIERFNSAEVAVTGVLADDGKLLTVNGETLSYKIARAFFSHLRYVVVPQANLESARSFIVGLQANFPRRQLLVIGASSLSDLVADHNVVRSEKICIGEWFGKQVVRYSRMTKVQVPLLAVLAYLLLCLVYPKAWVGFDWSASCVKIHGKTIHVENKSGQELWEHTFEFPNVIPDLDSQHWAVGNIDDDKENEVFFIPAIDDATPITGQMFAFDDNGDTLFTRDCIIRQRYPNDTIPFGQPAGSRGSAVDFGQFNGRPIIITTVNNQYPGRCHICFWDIHGSLKGRFISTGTSVFRVMTDFDDDGREEALFQNINNRLGCLGVFILDPDSAFGVSPPYWDKMYDLTWVERGKFKAWTMFIPTEVSKLLSSQKYQVGAGYRLTTGGSIDIWIDEGAPESPKVINYVVDGRLRVKAVRLGDSFRKILAIYMEKGLIDSMPEDAYTDTLRNRVTYYIDNQLVTEGELRSRLASANL